MALPSKKDEQRNRFSGYQKRKPEDAERRVGGNRNFDSLFKREFAVYKTKEGDNKIRILPPTWGGARHYGLDVFAHFGIGPDEQSYLCPYETLKRAKEEGVKELIALIKDDRCPICEERRAAKAEGDEEYAKKLRASNRVLIWLIDRADQKLGPQAWAMPRSVDEEFISISRDKFGGGVLELDNPDEGFDVAFDRKGQGLKTKYGGFLTQGRATPIAKDPAVMERWLDYISAHPLTSILNFYSYDYVRDVHRGGGKSVAPARDPDEAPRGTKLRDRVQEEEVGDEAPPQEETVSADDIPSEEEILEMDEDQLADLADALGLDVDLPTAKGLRKKQLLVLEALESVVGEEPAAEEESDAPVTKDQPASRRKLAQPKDAEEDPPFEPDPPSEEEEEPAVAKKTAASSSSISERLRKLKEKTRSK